MKMAKYLHIALLNSTMNEIFKQEDVKKNSKRHREKQGDVVQLLDLLIFATLLYLFEWHTFDWNCREFLAFFPTQTQTLLSDGIVHDVLCVLQFNRTKLRHSFSWIIP